MMIYVLKVSSAIVKASHLLFHNRSGKTAELERIAAEAQRAARENKMPHKDEVDSRLRMVCGNSIVRTRRLWIIVALIVLQMVRCQNNWSRSRNSSIPPSVRTTPYRQG